MEFRDSAGHLENAREEANRAVTEWVVLATHTMGEHAYQAEAVYAHLTQEAVHNITNVLRASDGRRREMVNRTVDTGYDKIARANLDGDLGSEVTAWFNSRMQAVATEEDGRAQTNETDANQAISVLRAKLNEVNVVNNSRLTESVNILGQRKNNTALPVLEQRIKEVTDQIDDLLNRKEGEISELTTRKVTQITHAVTQREHVLTDKLSALLARLDQEIAATRQKQARRQSQHNQQTNQKAGQNFGGGSQQHRVRGGRTENPSSSRASSQTAKEAPKPPDPRIEQLRGKSSQNAKRPVVTVLENVDKHRASGKTDPEIYRLLVAYFHPDAGRSEQGEDVMKVLGMAYDKTTKQFTF